MHKKGVLEVAWESITLLISLFQSLTYEQALDFFYNSTTFELISEGVADMHCFSDEYLADELMLERKKQAWRCQEKPLVFQQAIRCSLENFGQVDYIDPKSENAVRHVTIVPLYAVATFRN